MKSRASVRKLLVGVDFDEPSAAAVAQAGMIAERFGADLWLAHAMSVEMPPYFTQAQQHALEAEQQDARAHVADDLRGFAATHARVPATAIAEEGPAVDTLLRLADDFDLLVVGTHRYRGARRWWLGSVAEEVVRRATVPVLVVPAHEDATVAPPHGATLVTQRDAAVVEPWVGTFAEALGMSVVRSDSIVTCHAERLAAADLLIVPLPSEPSHFDAIVEVLKECSRPVLFVPAREAGAERRSV